jgi:HD superfamily phosphohydrolase
MTKYIKDVIYQDYLNFNKDDLKFINNRAFKRLSNIKQLGSLHEIFPGATHTRLAHSLGVSYLSEIFINKLYDNSDLIKNNTDIKDIRNIKIAGLYHDVGHGPFSHVFDNIVLKKLCKNNIFIEHETRSCNIIEKMCNTLFNNNEFNGYDIDEIKNYIDPKYNVTNFKNQIVSNKINSIDVDKLDYLKRDPYYVGFSYYFDHTRLINKMKIINNTIYYHENVVNDLFDMYYTRYKLHREIYNHKAVKSIELMIADILLDANDEYNYPSILNTDEFLNLDDNILTLIKYNKESSLNKSKMLIKRIENRDIYKQIYKSNNKSLEEVKDNILDKYKDNREDDYHFIKMNFNLCNGIDNPFNNIQFYNNNTNIINLDDIYIRKLIPNNYNEVVINVYKK